MAGQLNYKTKIIDMQIDLFTADEITSFSPAIAKQVLAAAVPEKHYPYWDKEKQHPFMFNKYFANAEQRTLSHANSLFLNYNCNENDLKEVDGRVICNSKEEIKAAFDKHNEKTHRKIFTILCPLSEGLEEFGYTPYRE